MTAAASARAADAAADGEGDEQLGAGARTTSRGSPPLTGGRDIEQDDLVGAARRCGAGQLGGVAGVAQIAEAYALDDAPSVDIETGDDALAQHVQKRSRIERPASPDFSGWNCTPQRLPRSTTALNGPP